MSDNEIKPIEEKSSSQKSDQTGQASSARASSPPRQGEPGSGAPAQGGPMAKEKLTLSGETMSGMGGPGFSKPGSIQAFAQSFGVGAGGAASFAGSSAAAQAFAQPQGAMPNPPAGTTPPSGTQGMQQQMQQMMTQMMQMQMQMMTQMMQMMQSMMQMTMGGNSSQNNNANNNANSNASNNTNNNNPINKNTNGKNVDNNPLQGNDKKQADFIDQYLAKKGSPAAGKGAGEMMVKYGKQYGVEPMALLAIAGQETQWGKTGIGVNGMLGVGAYDSDPNNATRNSKFSGIENQIRVGAQTFAKLRAKGGASASDSLDKQFAAVNSAGWATDKRWHNGCSSVYAQIIKAAQGMS